MSKIGYYEPCVEVHFVEIEEGFTASQGDDVWGVPGENPEENDFGEF